MNRSVVRLAGSLAEDRYNPAREANNQPTNIYRSIVRTHCAAVALSHTSSFIFHTLINSSIFSSIYRVLRSNNTIITMASPSASTSLRQRPSAAATSADQQPEPPQQQPQPQPQLQQDDDEQRHQAQDQQQPPRSSTLSQALTSTANLANLLPTGTLLAFNLLSPTFTNHGACDATTALLTRGLLALLALSCALASFTDSLRAPDGRVYYGVATPRGLWLLDYPPGAPPPPDTARYRLAFIDFVHAALSLAVFGVVAARDKNVVGCFLGPNPGRETAEVLDILPLGVGVLCSLLFVAFPTRRHGIGYPVTHH